MNVLYVNYLHTTVTGGGSRYPFELAVRVAARHPVRYASHLESLSDDWVAGTATTLDAPRDRRVSVERGLEVHPLGLGPVLRLAAYPVMRSTRFEAAWGTVVRLAFRGQLAPLVAWADIVHVLPLGRGYLADVVLREARRRGRSFVLTPFRHPTPSPASRRVATLSREADAVVAMTGVERDALIADGVEPGRIRVIPYGPLVSATPNHGVLRRRLPTAVGPLVLFLARKTRYKGLDLLLEAAAEVWRARPDVGFAVAGPDTDDSRALLAAVSDPRLLVLGELDDDDKAGALHDCDIFCMPSREESLGGVYLEAWSCAKPCVALDLPPLRELFGDEQHGLLSASDPAALARALLRLLDDPVAAAAMGVRGQQLVRDRFSWERVTDATEELYAGLLARRAG